MDQGAGDFEELALEYERVYTKATEEHEACAGRAGEAVKGRAVEQDGDEQCNEKLRPSGFNIGCVGKKEWVSLGVACHGRGDVDGHEGHEQRS